MEYQLKYNFNDKKITRDIIYWQSKDDIPLNIVEFIKDNSDKRILYETSTKKYYCAKCLELLDKNCYCSKCKVQHYKVKKKDYEDNKHVTILDKIDYQKIGYRNRYYVFDIVDNITYLYYIREYVTYNNRLVPGPYKLSLLEIEKAYLIEKDGVLDLKENKSVSYDMYYDTLSKLGTEMDEEKMEEYIDIFNFFDNSLIETSTYVYTDNLDELKNTIYQNSFIWEGKEFLETSNYYNLAMFTYSPLYFPQFEYLIKEKLYNLAFHISEEFKKYNKFKDILKVDKKYYEFIKNNNLDYQHLSALQLYPTEDLKTLNFISDNYYSFEILVKELNVPIKDTMNYFENNNLSYNKLYEYTDYLRLAKKFGYDLKDKKILWPKDLDEKHDEFYLQDKLANDPQLEEKIKKISKIANINKYEDDNYIIFPADSIKSLYDESRSQKNCVRIYCDRIADKECQIYFMRKKKEKNKSFVTIEVKDKKIVQARTKLNKPVSKEIKKVLDKWEENLKPIK